MKRSAFIKLISCLLTLVLLFTVSGATLVASAEETSGKYVKDVFVAYGENRIKAEQWLRNHGWEPFADLNDGKTSKTKTNAVAVMGIQRTNNPEEAITDMATMNMQGGYSFDDYEKLVKQKKADIDEFINSFVPALNEYRLNYKSKTRNGGKVRAQLAHDLLNKFYDGDPNDPNAVNDTGKPLGDLLLNKTKTELGEEAYAALSPEQKAKTADLQQIILESTGPAVLIVEQALALAADTSKKSWMQRLDGLTGEDLVENIELYAPEASGQDLAPSAAMSLLAAHFEDVSKKLAADWADVHEDVLWYEKYCDDHDLWMNEENADTYTERWEKHFNNLKEQNPQNYEEELNRYNRVNTYYLAIKKIAYSGDWGNTLYDFFHPKDDATDYSEEFKYFGPIAASLSAGQRAAVEFISLSTLLKLGADSNSVTKADIPRVKEIFKDKDGNQLERISIYSGFNRAIFRKGVALTSEALMQKHMGRDPYDKVWDLGGRIDIVSYVTLGTGLLTFAAGLTLARLTESLLTTHAEYVGEMLNNYNSACNSFFSHIQNQIDFMVEFGETVDVETVADAVDSAFNNRMYDVEHSLEMLEQAQRSEKIVQNMNIAGKWMMGIGGALMIMAAIIKAVQMVKYYHRDFSVIPRMIVEERKIVTKTTDADGNEVDHIDFDQFDYYEVAKCNRQEIGIHTSAQSGVSDYESWGCGDAADLNADVGKQWLALYVNRAGKKGQPILADSLKIETGEGSSTKPNGYDGCLHMFNDPSPVMLDNEDYCFRSDNEGMYVYWKTDANAYPEEVPATASAFNGGFLALAGLGGLALGIVGTTLVLFPKLKKKKEDAE